MLFMFILFDSIQSHTIFSRNCARTGVISSLPAWSSAIMTIHALWVINKAGGLVFSRQYSGEWNPGEMPMFVGA